MLVPVEIASFAVDPARNTPLVVLRQTGGQRTVAIPIGPHEASAIAIKSLNVTPERPMTVDLVKTIVASLGGVLERVIITDVENQSFTARLQIRAGRSVTVAECSASDAISLALRSEAPLFVAELVFEKQNGNPVPPPNELLRRSIAELDTLAFGRYHLE